MDEYWLAVIGFLNEAGLAGTAITAPSEFAPQIVLSGSYRDGAQVVTADVLVLHKGRYVELDPSALRQALDRLTVVYANEVFIVLANRGEAIPADTTHVGPLARIVEWVEDRVYGGGEPALAVRNGRMAATYVGAGRVLLQTAFGHLMLAAGNDTSITPHLIRDGWFDLGLTRFLNHMLKPGMTYVDVGANFGTYALIAGDIVGPGGRIVAVEANPRIAGLLHENLVMNGFGARAMVERVAVGDTPGDITMYEFAIRQGGNTMIRAVAEQAQADYAEQVREHVVPCHTLDRLLEQRGIDRIDILKIDVEGFELPVLKGARRAIARSRPVLVMEWHPAFMSAGDGAALYHELCEVHGYRLRRVEGDGSTTSTDRAALMQLNHSDVVAVPPVGNGTHPLAPPSFVIS